MSTHSDDEGRDEERDCESNEGDQRSTPPRRSIHALKSIERGRKLTDGRRSTIGEAIGAVAHHRAPKKRVDSAKHDLRRDREISLGL